MKKILCFALIAVILTSLFCVAVSAEVTDNDSIEKNEGIVSATDDETEWLFYEKFCDHYIEGNDSVEFYEELYYHYNADGEMEWALIHGRTEMFIMWVNTPYAIFENRIIRKTTPINNFHVDYALYVVDDGKFYDLVEIWKDERYTEDIYNALSDLNIGEIIGDMDKDGKLTIRDATYIQKCLAEIMNFPEDDVVPYGYNSEFYGELKFISDFNRDGNRSIKDATAIQKYIADLS